MMQSNPCNVCGGTDVNLVDGFYYCIECGTQDTTARETIVEHTEVADGVFASYKTTAVRKKTEVPQMSEEWHKWHAYNFILCGLADELIVLGAKPTFKPKLLWIWSRYIRKYKRKKNDDKLKESELLVEDENNSDNNSTDGSAEDDKRKKEVNLGNFKIWHMIAMLYVALNMDNSAIKLSDIKRFIREKRLSFVTFEKFLPPEINKKKISGFGYFKNNKINVRSKSPQDYTILGHVLCQKLNLGTILVPDLREYVNVFTKELCLPKDFRELVYSLLQFIPVKRMIEASKSFTNGLPDFDTIVMAYVLMALKMCFGLDDDYDVKLSDAVDEINAKENHLKSYRVGMSEPTDRLFSFREWIAHLEFRKMIVTKHYHPMATNYDMEEDDYKAHDCVKEHTFDNGIKQSSVELAHDIAKKLPCDIDFEVMPRHLFPASKTPITTYTEFILPKIKDPHSMLLLSEDFSKYSLIYACQKLVLKSDETSENQIKGVSMVNKKVVPSSHFKFNEIRSFFVKDTDNKDWIRDFQEIMYKNKKLPILYNNGLNIEKACLSTSEQCTKIEDVEEIEDDQNIFNEIFTEVDIEEKYDVSERQQDDEIVFNFSDKEIDNFWDQSNAERKSSIQDIDENLQREELIKQLIIATCFKYKIRVPKHIRAKSPYKKRKIDTEVPKKVSAPKRPKAKKFPLFRVPNGPDKVADIVAKYYSTLQNDAQEFNKEIANDTLPETTDNDRDSQIDINADQNDCTEEPLSIDNDHPNVQNITKIADEDNCTRSEKTLKEMLKDFNVETNESLYEDPAIRNIIFKIKSEKIDRLKEVFQVNGANAKEHRITEKENNQQLQPFIENVESCLENGHNYYMRHWCFNKGRESQEYKFEKDLMDYYPNSFRYILKTCASLIEVSPWYLNTHLQMLEQQYLKIKKANLDAVSQDLTSRDTGKMSASKRATSSGISSSNKSRKRTTSSEKFPSSSSKSRKRTTSPEKFPSTSSKSRKRATSSEKSSSNSKGSCRRTGSSGETALARILATYQLLDENPYRALGLPE